MYRPVPLKPDFHAIEQGALALWERTHAFDQLRARNAAGPIWSFIDGPITANNPMGVHHAWGRTYKDLFQRYKAMQGFHERYQNGFDCQGLWVEVEVEKELGFNSKHDIEAFGIENFSRKCRERVYRYAGIITEQSQRLGMWNDWDDSYYTLSDNNIQHIWKFLQTCNDKGWLYKGARSMPWCVRCETGLSQHELVGTDSYTELTHTSVYLKLPIVERPGAFFLVWTTTPWTLAANVALAVHPDLDYLEVRQAGETLIVSAGAAAQALEGPYEVVGRVKGAALVGLHYRGPFDELEAVRGIEHRVIPWENVGEAEGTGIVHIAPGAGAEDFELSKVHQLPALVPIGESGDYYDTYGFLAGQNVRGVAARIFDSLRDKGLLYRTAPITHRYPTCWRCKSELVFRLSEEWYISVDEIRPRMKRAAAEVEWVPPSGGKRMQDWLDNMGDWNISRRRYWGLPLPFYPCQSCGELTILGSIQELAERAVSGLDQLSELHRPWIDAVQIACPNCSAPVTRITEVGDVWLDAGIVPFSTLRFMYDPAYWREWFPADFITEMREQIRLWFYSMLFMSVTLENRAPYQAALAYEKLMDERGEPMHRSKGNAIWFDEAVEQMGADVMRWLYASQNISSNLLFGYTPAREVAQRLLTLWNVYRLFVLYAREDDFRPAEHPVPTARRSLLDRWILSRYAALVETVRETLDGYDPGPATAAIERFVDDLSTWYVRRSRERFWKAEGDRDKWAAYHTLYDVLLGLTKLIAPFMPFLAEELYQNLVRSVDESAPDSVHLLLYPLADEAERDPALEGAVERARRVVALGRAARGAAQIRVRQPLARLAVRFSDDGAELAPELVAQIADELNVKRIELVRDLAGAVEHVVTPKPEILGKKYGRRYPEIREALKAGRFDVLPGGAVRVGDVTLEPGEATVSTRGLPGFQVSEEDGTLVALDLAIGDELRREGLAREIVRHLQDLRKEAAFEIADRIVVGYASDAAELRRVFAEHGGYIGGETLATELRDTIGPEMVTWSGDLEGLPLTLGVRRAAAG